MARKIAFINYKGGVGKTSLIVNVAASLAKAGKRVLLCDFDTQSNASIWLLKLDCWNKINTSGEGAVYSLFDPGKARLKDTLAFDDPFGDMVAQTEEAEKKDNQMLRNMARLEIPEDFPITMTALGRETQEFCKLEKLATLGQFAVFAQGMAQNVIVGGDFRKLLNALSHVDEQALAEVLPFRPGAKGLHLIEALALAAASPAAADRAAAALAHFAAEFNALKLDIAAGGSLPRHLMVLAKPDREAKVAELLKPHLARAAEGDTARKGGFFSRLFKK